MAKDDACIAEVIAGLSNVETIVGGLEALIVSEDTPIGDKDMLSGRVSALGKAKAIL